MPQIPNLFKVGDRAIVLLDGVWHPLSDPESLRQAGIDIASLPPINYSLSNRDSGPMSLSVFLKNSEYNASSPNSFQPDQLVAIWQVMKSLGIQSQLPAGEQQRVIQAAGLSETPPAPVQEESRQPGQRYGETLTLPNGQRISVQDPSYDAYAAQLGVTGASGVTAAIAPEASPAQGTSAAAAPLPPAKGAFKESSYYKGLSDDLKGLVDLAFSTFSGTPEQQRIFSDALANAQALADPYSKTQLALARGEFESKIAFSQGDLKRASDVIKRTRDQLLEDIGTGKEALSLEQQAEISRQSTAYQSDLLEIADQAAEKGLTFATGARSRSLAEERRGEQFQDVIQSSNRTYNLKNKELELRATRGDVDAQKQLEDIKAKSSFNLEQIGRSAERVLGTLGTSNLSGGTPNYTPVGGSLGDIEQERREAIISAASLAIPK